MRIIEKNINIHMRQENAAYRKIIAERVAEEQRQSGRCGRRLDGGWWICDVCESMWSITLAETGWLPRMCRERPKC